MDNEEDYKKKPRNFGRNAPAEHGSYTADPVRQ